MKGGIEKPGSNDFHDADAKSQWRWVAGRFVAVFIRMRRMVIPLKPGGNDLQLKAAELRDRK